MPILTGVSTRGLEGPVAKSASEQIESLRRVASGKFINASEKGIYNNNTMPNVVKTTGRKFD